MTRIEKVARRHPATRFTMFIVGVALACGLGLATPPTRAADLQTVTLGLDFLPTAYHAPLFLGVVKGEYKAEGIDLQISDGKGSNVALQAVAAGNVMIVLANYATMAQAVGQGMPVVAIGGLVERLPDSVISLKGSGLKTPKDLEGHSMTIPPASAVFRLFRAFAAATGIDLDKIKQIQTDSNATLTGLLQGQVDFTVGWAFTDALKVASQKPIEPPMLFADYGVNVLGTGFVVQKQTVAKDRALLQRFLAVTANVYAEAAKNPKAAAAAMAVARPNVDPALILSQFELFPRFLNSKRSEGHGFGWMSAEDWAETIEILKKYFDMKETVDVASLYTNDLLPSK
jgi:NitT/TauT family transport system substrate-binding protein